MGMELEEAKSITECLRAQKGTTEPSSSIGSFVRRNWMPWVRIESGNGIWKDYAVEACIAFETKYP